MILPYLIYPSSSPVFPDFLEPDETGLIAVGGNLSEEVLIEAYSKGIFPWIVGPPIMWFSPDPRLVLFPDKLHISKKLAGMIKKGFYSVRFDQDFEAVISACAAVPRKHEQGTWIGDEIKTAYCRLFKRCIAHCVAVYQNNRLCGGLYGVSLGRIFFGESMFSFKSDASKVALYNLTEWVRNRNFVLIDCQVRSEHLVRMGAEEITRFRFNKLLAEGLRFPSLNFFWNEDSSV